MIELAIGTRFYYKGRLCEVVEIGYKLGCCFECDISDSKCDIMSCTPISRHDGKNVCFKWVEE